MLDDAEWYHMRCVHKILKWRCKECGYFTSDKDDFSCYECGGEEYERVNRKIRSEAFAGSIECPDNE